MPTLVQVRDTVDAWLTARWSFVVNAQDNYFANRGKYFQGLWTHTAEPEYTESTGEDVLPDNADSTPTDQTESWRDFLEAAINVPIPCAFKADVYQNADGWGWTLTVGVKYNGTIYIRRQNGAGSEADRTHNWRVR